MKRKEVKIPIHEWNKFDFYKKGFYICFVYVIWDLFRAWGWI